VAVTAAVPGLLINRKERYPPPTATCGKIKAFSPAGSVVVVVLVDVVVVVLVDVVVVVLVDVVVVVLVDVVVLADVVVVVLDTVVVVVVCEG
jgi:hypothetical protein